MSKGCFGMLESQLVQVIPWHSCSYEVALRLVLETVMRDGSRWELRVKRRNARLLRSGDELRIMTSSWLLCASSGVKASSVSLGKISSTP